MTLQETTQILGGLGVIASLIYVAIQIRNNARAVRAATYHQVSNTFISNWESASRDADTLSIILRGGRDLASLTDEVEMGRLYLFVMASMRRFENAWFQYKVGILKETDWQAIAYDMDSLFVHPGLRLAWEGVKNRSSAEFRDYVDVVSRRQAALAPPPPALDPVKAK